MQHPVAKICSHKKEKVLKMTKKSRKIGHYSETTGPIGLKFFVKVDFGHGVLHTKFQPSRLKDAEDIGWCG